MATATARSQNGKLVQASMTTTFGSRDGRDSTVAIEKVLVTPALAAEWLEHRNKRNRTICRPRVDLYVSLIKDRRFVLTHQGIAFYDDGQLADGQHRLQAIVEAGIPVWMMVTTGLPVESIHAIDNGRPRSLQNVLHFVGIELSHKHIAAARVLWMQYHAQRSGTLWDAQSIDTGVFTEFVKVTQEPIEFATPASRTRGISHASVTGAIASAWFTQDRDLLSRFQQLLCDGAGAARDEQAAIRLREFLLTTSLTQGGTSARQELFIRVCTALRAYLEGRSLQKLYCREDSVFPIPDIAGI
jgi:hypothetical protein